MRTHGLAVSVVVLLASAVLPCVPRGPVARAQTCASIMEALAGAADFRQTAQAMRLAGLDDALSRPGAYTLFAPDEAAFRKFPAWQVNYVMHHKNLVADLVRHHILDGTVLSPTQLEHATTLQPLAGKEISVVVRDGAVWLDGKAKVMGLGQVCANGIVYAIDGVLLQ